MIVKRNVDVKVIWLLFVIVAVFSAITLYLGTIHRFTYAFKYENYTQKNALVNSIQRYESEDSENNSYYTYAVEIGYSVDGKDYTQVTDDIFSGDDVPDEGGRVPILYCNDNPSEYTVVKYDWMSRTLVPQEDNGDQWLFVSLLLIAFTLIILAMAIGNDRTREPILGSGLVLMGINGIVMGIMLHKYELFFLIIFGAVGILVFYRYFSKSE